MIAIPAGKFRMGSAAAPDVPCDALRPRESPRHEVAINHLFAVSQTEVTFDQWNVCVKAGDCQEADDFTWGGGNRPVIGVGWPAAIVYTRWLSRLSGKDYRLLSEAEWEYAARAGSNASYSFGDNESELDQYAWFKNNSENKTQPVGQKHAYAFGLLDIYGNVDEWVEDTFHPSYEGAPTDGSAWVINGDKGAAWFGAAAGTTSLKASAPPVATPERVTVAPTTTSAFESQGTLRPADRYSSASPPRFPSSISLSNSPAGQPNIHR